MDLPLLQGPAVDPNGVVFASLEIQVAGYSADKSFDQQVDEFIQDLSDIDPANFEHARINVAGESAILVERARIPSDDGQGQPSQMNWRIVFLHHGSSLYRLIYRPADEPAIKADFEELYQVTTSSFTFLK